MSVAPVNRLRKNEILQLSRGHCKKHRHSFLEHYSCFLRENPHRERIGFLDIETTDFKADRGIVISYCIKDSYTGKTYVGRIKGRDILSKTKDKRVLKQFLEDLSNFDRVITFYGKGFDVPFLRTRALIHGLNFPLFGWMNHDDVYFIARSKLRLSRNTQENVSRLIGGKTDKTHFDFKVWDAARDGKEWAIKKIVDHNKRDIKDLERIYKKLIGFSRKQNASI